ncbi:allophanate hydrolase [Paenibacillus xylanilyticus]|uniref:Allophanate hydrolase n=1 Tax=Paenibacillus xylanilyticus TaxID=248903 RepID=A0A7Y6EUP9_9BACL|nr:allophanate hydrolase [Paenibacillus xylanilyticus]NUU74978.1 allophanate hydrolase [Paenibacillus xylanilyticus]
MTVHAIPKIMTIEALRTGYLRGSFTPLEVIESIVQRARDSEDYHVWITPPSLELIAPYLVNIQHMSVTEYPLWGIPFAIKDNIEVRGWPVTAGCPEFSSISEQHAIVVERLIAAGAIPVGKTNLDQFATGLVGTRSPYGETHNALRPELISGGSSSGSAVAVALGQAAFSLGTDTAGSGRIPAALHGLIGYKPAVGAWPSTGLVPACRSIDCITVFAHDLEDAVAVDRTVRGPHSEDPFSKDRPLGPTRAPAKWLLPQGKLNFFGPFAEAYETAWLTAKQTMLQSGLNVEEVDISLLQEAAALLYEGPLVAERWADLEMFVEQHPGTLFPVTENILRTGSKETFTAAALFRAQHRLAEIRRSTEELLQNAVLILPTCGGTWTREQVCQDPVQTNSQMGLYTNHCNLLDLSAIAIPAGKVAEDMPFGITLFTLPEHEAAMVEAAKMVEQYQERILVAVCGLHMRGMSLEPQMTSFGAFFVEEAQTAPAYRLYKLDTNPPKPGLVHTHENGEAIELELWSMPLSSFGAFTAAIPAPLGMGKIQLYDGRVVSGFICEASAAQDGVDMTQLGGWRNIVLGDLEETKQASNV